MSIRIIHRTISASRSFANNFLRLVSKRALSQFTYNTAIVRDIDESLISSALTSNEEERAKLDLNLALSQHQQLVHALAETGIRIQSLPSDGFPDSVFVEDTVVIIGDTAVITNPGADERKGEVEGVERFLRSAYSSCLRIESFNDLRQKAESYIPLIEQHGQAVIGTLDGGDVLFTGKYEKYEFDFRIPHEHDILI